ncbi:hypothetical protein GGS23DRAFT_398214 [Durotheca rogersii]|uniref:uncharacterized protein n=1 Tax=Durotheca rogersii TaxID=419775 RepID=UPI00222016CF|nr:uncharacterized protein GGS23DRAFT_398214 [Durotheca rogersii]KAI5856644.1 hypothetical protein GGS23DRAFT_398214 [Durotheca rogersii]
MPYFRKVEVSVVAGPEAQTLPEYPHPHGSSVRLVKVDRGPQSPHAFSYQHRTGDDGPTNHKKANPHMAVFIPSSPGQFWVRYIIDQPPPSKFLFFKMSINGHRMTSWGVDTATCSSGSVTRHLYEPSDGLKAVSKSAGGASATKIEARTFYFLPGLEGGLAIERGGFIEIQVFRCRERKPAAPDLSAYQYRRQERFGIVLPSTGFMDNPEQATFYKYHLDDPRDSPYATFSFHYSSMEDLGQLGVTPQDESKSHLSCINTGSTLTSDPRHAHPKITPSRPMRWSPSDAGFPGLEECSQTSTLPLPPISPARTTTDNLEIIERDGAMDEIPCTQLPKIPRVFLRQESRDSLKSNCPSLTSSLKDYIDSEDFGDADVAVCTAQAILVPVSESSSSNMTSHG